MNIEFKKISGIAAVLATLTAAPVMAQGLAEWDGDGNGFLSQEEFSEGWNSVYDDGESAFSTWDEDGDGALNEDEFNTGTFNSYDDDGSGMIEEPEFGDVSDDLGDGGFWDV